MYVQDIRLTLQSEKEYVSKSSMTFVTSIHVPLRMDLNLFSDILFFDFTSSAIIRSIHDD